jgi:hypothetical protein
LFYPWLLVFGFKQERRRRLPKIFLISKKTPQNAGAALGMVGSSPQLSGAADAMSSD